MNTSRLEVFGADEERPTRLPPEKTTTPRLAQTVYLSEILLVAKMPRPFRAVVRLPREQDRQGSLPMPLIGTSNTRERLGGADPSFEVLTQELGIVPGF